MHNSKNETIKVLVKNIYGKKDLLIPHPKEDPEAYAKAKGNRKLHPEGHGNEK